VLDVENIHPLTESKTGGSDRSDKRLFCIPEPTNLTTIAPPGANDRSRVNAYTSSEKRRCKVPQGPRHVKFADELITFASQSKARRIVP
jgi:hypothetical protein